MSINRPPPKSRSKLKSKPQQTLSTTKSASLLPYIQFQSKVLSLFLCLQAILKVFLRTEFDGFKRQVAK